MESSIDDMLLMMSRIGLDEGFLKKTQVAREGGVLIKGRANLILEDKRKKEKNPSAHAHSSSSTPQKSEGLRRYDRRTLRLEIDHSKKAKTNRSQPNSEAPSHSKKKAKTNPSHLKSQQGSSSARSEYGGPDSEKVEISVERRGGVEEADLPEDMDRRRGDSIFGRHDRL
ncbi:hypothetical protein NL676_029975 [Syzygium grande]|nr:hypothetical protein NL676_029975 [Syzygium grande]